MFRITGLHLRLDILPRRRSSAATAGSAEARALHRWSPPPPGPWVYALGSSSNPCRRLIVGSSLSTWRLVGSPSRCRTTTNVPGITQIKTVCAAFCGLSKIGLRQSARVVTALTPATTAAPTIPIASGRVIRPSCRTSWRSARGETPSAATPCSAGYPAIFPPPRMRKRAIFSSASDSSIWAPGGESRSSSDGATCRHI